MKNPYDVLGVSPDTSSEEMKKVYKELARKWHPDLHSGDKNAEEKFKEINSAYEMIKSGEWEKRQRQQQFNGINLNFEDVFRQHFGRGNPFDSNARTTRRDRGQIKITFEEAYSGCEKKLQLKKIESCEACKGIGFHLKDDICKSCNGQGQVARQHGPMRIIVPCTACRGIGHETGDSCDKCSGSGKILKIDEFNIKIPPKTRHGTILHPNATLDVVINYLEHSEFSLANNLCDVVSMVSINIFDAILGGSITVNTLSGKKILKIPNETKHGATLRIKGSGFDNGHGTQGNHLVIVNIDLPEKLNEKQKDLLIQLKNSIQKGDDNGRKD
jgi:molecular chaperone DnaJ